MIATNSVYDWAGNCKSQAPGNPQWSEAAWVQQFLASLYCQTIAISTDKKHDWAPIHIQVAFFVLCNSI